MVGTQKKEVWAASFAGDEGKDTDGPPTLNAGRTQETDNEESSPRQADRSASEQNNDASLQTPIVPVENPSDSMHLTSNVSTFFVNPRVLDEGNQTVSPAAGVPSYGNPLCRPYSQGCMHWTPKKNPSGGHVGNLMGMLPKSFTSEKRIAYLDDGKAALFSLGHDEELSKTGNASTHVDNLTHNEYTAYPGHFDLLSQEEKNDFEKKRLLAVLKAALTLCEEI